MDKRKSESIVVIKKVIYIFITFLENFSYVIAKCKEDHKNLSVFFEGYNIILIFFYIMF